MVRRVAACSTVPDRHEIFQLCSRMVDETAAALPITAALCSWFAVRRLAAGEFAELDVGQEDELPE